MKLKKRYRWVCVVFLFVCITSSLSLVDSYAYWGNMASSSSKELDITICIGSWNNSSEVIAEGVINLNNTMLPDSYTFKYGDVYYWNNNYYSVISRGGGVTIENVKKPNAGEWAVQYHGWIWTPGIIGVNKHVYALNDASGDLYYTKASKPNIAPSDESAKYWAYDAYGQALYNETTIYKNGQPVRYNGSIYQVYDATLANKNRPTPEQDKDTGWNRVDSYEWISHNMYEVGSIVVKDGKLFRCTQRNSGVNPLNLNQKAWELYA